MIFIWLSYDFVLVIIYILFIIYIYIYIYIYVCIYMFIRCYIDITFDSIYLISVNLLIFINCFFLSLFLFATMVPWEGSMKLVIYQIMHFASILYLKTTSLKYNKVDFPCFRKFGVNSKDFTLKRHLILSAFNSPSFF